MEDKKLKFASAFKQIQIQDFLKDKKVYVDFIFDIITSSLKLLQILEFHGRYF